MWSSNSRKNRNSFVLIRLRLTFLDRKPYNRDFDYYKILPSSIYHPLATSSLTIPSFSCSLFKLFTRLGEEEIDYDFQYRFHVREVEQILPQLKVTLHFSLFMLATTKTNFSTTPSGTASTRSSPRARTTDSPSRTCWTCVLWCRTSARTKWRRPGRSESTVLIAPANWSSSISLASFQITTMTASSARRILARWSISSPPGRIPRGS